MPMAHLAAGLLAAATISLVGVQPVAAGFPGDDAIARVIGALVKPQEPGCTVGVVEGGVLTHALAFGMSDLAQARALDTHAAFNLASVSKQFTAFALLLLEQQGKLKLDDPVVNYVPEIAQSAQGVTLRHLVHHTGGLRDYIELLTMKGRGTDDGATIHEAVQALARQTAPNQAPGVEFDYSNTGYFLLGVVIARVAGESLADFSRKQIFEPLGMKNTSIVDRYPAGIESLARGYAKEGESFEIDETGWEQVGDGQVHSDIHDLALWDENFYTGKLGGRALVDRMYEVGRLNSGESTEYAAGLAVSESRGLRWVSHGGSWVGYRSSIVRVPAERFSTIVLCNREDADAGQLAREVAGIFLAGKIGPPEPEEEELEETPVAAKWQPKDLARYAGAYFSEEADARCVIDERGGALLLEGCVAGAALRPGKTGEFVTGDDGLTLRFGGAGTDVDGFVYWSPALRGIPFKRVKEPSQ
jgi:CubicO group peptidase (beta-lactamase class C family)